MACLCISGFEDLQQFVFNEFDVEEGEVAEAVNYYIKAGNLELKKIKEGIRKVFKMFGGDLEEEDEEEIEDEEEKILGGEGDDDYEDIDVDVDEEVNLITFLNENKTHRY